MKQIAMNRKTNLTVEEAFQLFVRKCSARNLSEKSIVSYKDKISPFIELIGGKIEDVTMDAVDNFVIYLRDERQVRDSSVYSYLQSIRAFLYYCMDCGWMKKFKIPLPKVEQKIKETYTNEELEKLLKRPDINSCDFTEFKVWAFENYLLATGNRLSTALNLKIGDLDFESDSIFLRKTKSRKQQIIPLSHTLAEVLREYLEIRGGSQDDYVFCNNYGGQASIRGFQTLVYRYNVKRGVNRTSCHAFRHTFAKNWILAGGDIARLKTILGHSNISVTNTYLQMFGMDLQMDFERFNPLDRLSVNRITIRM